MSRENDSPTDIDPRDIDAMTVWPTIGATEVGRFVGRLAAVRLGFGSFFTLGTVLAVATVPLSLAVFAWQLMPVVCRRYTLTDRRIIIRKGLSAVDGASLDLDHFDSIEVQVLPGHAWLRSGDLIFRDRGNEVLRLRGVSRPEVFREACLKVREALLSVRRVVQEQEAARETAPA